MLRALPADSPLREDLNVIVTQIDRISRMIRAALDPFRQREPARAAVAPGLGRGRAPAACSSTSRRAAG